MAKSKIIIGIIIMCISFGYANSQDSAAAKSKLDVIIQPLAQHNVVLSSNVIELLLKGPNIMYEQSINGNHGLTAKLTYDFSPTDDLLYLESSYRWYIWQPTSTRPLTGLAVGPYVKMTQQLSGKGTFTFGAGGEVAYKWIWFQNFEFEPAILISYPYKFDLRLNFGYAF